MLKRLPSLLEFFILPLAVIALLRWQRHEQEALCNAYMQTEYGAVLDPEFKRQLWIDAVEDKLTT